MLPSHTDAGGTAQSVSPLHQEQRAYQRSASDSWPRPDRAQEECTLCVYVCVCVVRLLYGAAPVHQAAFPLKPRAMQVM